MFGLSLQAASQVTDKLLERFGVQELRQVEQLSKHSFRAHLAGGEIALAVIGEDGTVRIKEPEADLWAGA